MEHQWEKAKSLQVKSSFPPRVLGSEGFGAMRWLKVEARGLLGEWKQEGRGEACLLWPKGKEMGNHGLLLSLGVKGPPDCLPGCPHSSGYLHSSPDWEQTLCLSLARTWRRHSYPRSADKEIQAQRVSMTCPKIHYWETESGLHSGCQD